MSDAMRKVVINACFGGFGLSPYAVQRLAELQGRECYFFVNDQTGGRIDFRSYVRVTVEQAAAAFMFSAFDVPEYPASPDPEKWASMTQDDRIAHNAEWLSHSIGNDIDRDDPFLVQVVEELGAKANGQCAELRIVEIPADAEWGIDEYDGNEHVAEKHRSWR